MQYDIRYSYHYWVGNELLSLYWNITMLIINNHKRVIWFLAIFLWGSFCSCIISIQSEFYIHVLQDVGFIDPCTSINVRDVIFVISEDSAKKMLDAIIDQGLIIRFTLQQLDDIYRKHLFDLERAYVAYSFLIDDQFFYGILRSAALFRCVQDGLGCVSFLDDL